jgi:hypothetical protein
MIMSLQLPKNDGGFGVADQPVTFQEELSCVELVN